MPKSPRQQQQQQRKAGTGAAATSATQQQQQLLPEIEAYLHLLMTLYLLDQKRLDEVGFFLVMALDVAGGVNLDAFRLISALDIS